MNSDQAQESAATEGHADGNPLRVLLVEDSELDARLVAGYLQSSGYKVQFERVDNGPTMEAALDRGPWDIVLCDFGLPSFDFESALALVKKRKLDLPFIVVSGTVGEKVAVEVMKAGAHDFIVKDNLIRLAPAIERELREAQVRAQNAAGLQKLFYLAAIVDSTGEAIFSQNMDGVITTWNAGARQLFHYTEEETLGNSALMLVPEGSRQSTKELFDGLRGGQPIEPFETVRLRKDATPLDVYVAISTIKGADGQIMGASTIAYDITERKKIEDERTTMIKQLNETLSKVRTLSGLLPICSSCKKIRDDHGYWQRLETFVHEHSNAEFSHSICPECMERLYPDFTKH